jgi:uncharacterized protein (DUF488 family)
MELWTVGHSNRAWDDFLALLQGGKRQAQSIGALADVRRFPSSRKHPQFNGEPMARALADAGIEYLHLPELGGRRQPRADSVNTAWRNASFRGYADYMETAPFKAGIERLLQLAERKRTAVMCAEAVWWQCHRALISDYLQSRGIDVFHILGAGSDAAKHPFTSAATLIDGRLSYAGAQPRLL